jgi:hypothetical protein
MSVAKAHVKGEHTNQNHPAGTAGNAIAPAEHEAVKAPLPHPPGGRKKARELM